MTQRANADTIVMRLEQTIDKAADQALGALGRLERQIAREQNQLGRLDQSLAETKRQYEALAAGSPDKGVMAALEKQRSKVESLSEAFRAGKVSADELAQAQAKLERLGAASQFKVVDEKALRKQENAIAVLTDKIGAQRDKIGALSEKLSQGEKQSRQMGDAAKYLGDRTGVTNNATFKLLSQLKQFGPVAAIVVAGMLLVVSSIGAYVGMIAKGLSASAQMRAEFLKLQAASVSNAYGFSWLWNATRESSRGAEEMQRSIDKVGRSSALGRDKLVEFATQIRQARFYGKDFETVLKAMSTAASGGTEQMAQDVLGWARNIRFMGGQVDDLARRVEQKLGRSATAQALSFDVQMRKLSESIRWIFGGSDIDPLLRALRSVLKYFDAGSDTATSMRNAITRMVEGAIGLMLRLGIVLLKTYIALRSHDTAWRAMGLVLKGAAIFLGAVAVAAALLVTTGLAIIPGAIALAVAGFKHLINVLGEIKDAVLESIAGWGEIGKNIALGIAEGVTNGAQVVWDAIKGLATGAVKKFKDTLGIHSPSVVFKADSRVGIGGGVSSGIEQAIPQVRLSTQRLAVASHDGFSRANAGMAMNVRGLGYDVRASNDILPPFLAPETPPANDVYAPIKRKDERRRDDDDRRPPTDDRGRGGDDKPTFVFHFEGCTFGAGVTQESLEPLFVAAAEKQMLGRASNG